MLKEFVVSDVFGNAQHRKYHPPETLVPDDNGYPYICASNQNNGINKNLPYVNGTDIQLTPQKIIAWGKQCPMFCYHDRPCVCSQGMYFLDMTEYAEEISLYVCGALSAATHGKYNYSNCLTGEKMDREHVSLPVVESEDPGHVYTADDIDWNYMRSRVRELEQERVRELEQERVRELDAYLKAAELNDYELTQEDKDILMLHKKRETSAKTFKIEDLFDVSIAKAIDKRNVIFSNDGKHDFVGRSTENYGVQGKLFELSYKPNDAKTFSLVQVGTSACLYRERSWYASQNIFLLNPKDDRICDAHMYFEATINAYLQSKYSSAYIYPKMSDVKDMQILLPASASGQPDFAFMERYITAMEKQTIADVVRYKDRIIEATKKVVSSAVAS